MTSSVEYEGFDCSNAQLQVYQFLDGEMAADDCAKMQAHLDHCDQCLKEYRMDQTLKALIRRSCGCEAAPTELRTQIMSRITTIIVTIDLTE